MNFPNVKLLKYDHKNDFWGDQTFRYSSTVSMSIRGYILDLANTEGVANVFSACKNLSEAAGGLQNIVINGQSYGVGMITGVTFDSGNWVKVTEYTASIEILKEGSITDTISSKEFSNGIINSIKNGARFLKEFSESYSADYSSNSDSISGSHSIDITMSSFYTGSKIDFAQNLAAVLFSKTFIENLSEIAYLKPSESLRKDYYSENYDIINGSCGFKRNFSYSNTADCFSRKRSISVELGENGVTNVTESNSIQGECLTSTLLDSAKVGLSEISGAFVRCSQAFDDYKAKFEIVEALINKEIQKSVKTNRFTGEIEYSVSFTNDKKRVNSYYWEYSLELSRSEDFIWNFVESGSVKGEGKVTSIERFNSALAGWAIVKGGIESRAGAFYASHAKIKPIPGILKNVNRSVTRAPIGGEISYSWSFTDDTTLDMSSPIRRKKIDITNLQAIDIHNDFVIPGGQTPYSLAQGANQVKQSEREVKGDLEITSPTVPFDGKTYFNDCVGLANSNRGGGSDLYLETFSFSSDEIEQTIQFNAKYKHSS